MTHFIQERNPSRGVKLDFCNEDSETDSVVQDSWSAVTNLDPDVKEVSFLYRMECISRMKENTKENAKDHADFSKALEPLKELWGSVTVEDLDIAAVSGSGNLNKLFDVITLHVPPAEREVDIYIGHKVLHQPKWHLPSDSVFFSSLRGKRRFFAFQAGEDTEMDNERCCCWLRKEVGDLFFNKDKVEEATWKKDNVESLWRKHVDNWRNQSFGDDCKVQVDVDVVGVALMKQKDADLILMMVLAKFTPEEAYAVSAHAFLYMCWWNQMPLYLINVFAACASIIALIDITFCTKVLSCSDSHPFEVCCTDPYHSFSPMVVLGVGLWFLITDVICAYILLRDTLHARSVFQTSKVFEFILEGITTVIAGKMAVNGWVFATQHYVQYFLVVSCRWLHLLYILIPVPFFGRTVLPMYQAIFSYESKAFMAVNLVMLAGTFQAYVSLRSDINAQNYEGDLRQPFGDALLAQYRLNFLGDFSTEDLMGESEVIDPEHGIIKTKSGSAHQRQGIAVFMIFTTFIQAVLMLNLYIGVLGNSYAEHKKKVDIEFMQFRANFMLKNMCILRFLSKIGLEWLTKFFEGMWGFDKEKTQLVWAISPHELSNQEDGDTKAVDKKEGVERWEKQMKEEVKSRSHDLKSFMDELRCW